MSAPKNPWPLGFCDCLTYRDRLGDCKCFPTFIPKAVCGTCFLVGEAYSNHLEEDIMCCNMGSKGLCCCIISTPINILGPFGGQMLTETGVQIIVLLSPQ